MFSGLVLITSASLTFDPVAAPHPSGSGARALCRPPPDAARNGNARQRNRTHLPPARCRFPNRGKYESKRAATLLAEARVNVDDATRFNLQKQRLVCAYLNKTNTIQKYSHV